MADFELTRFLPFRLNRLATEVSEELAALYAARFGIDVPQWRVLATLSSGEGWTAKAIVASTRTHKSTISRAVEALSRRGLIESLQSADDKRAFRLRLTVAGRKLFRQLEPLVLDYERRLLARLSQAEGRALEKGVSALERTLKLEEPRDEAL